MNITRRDFLNGVAIAIGSIGAGGLAPYSHAAGSSSPKITPQNLYYPPTQTGIRGNHDGSFEIAHALSWKNTKYDLSKATDKGEYDLVVIGAGISGLTAAYEFKKHRPKSKILILDNHDDFGGHAKRNEFSFDGGMRISFGGSESFETPSANFNQDILNLMDDLGIDYKKFDSFYDQTFNERHQLIKGTFFNQSAFGKSTIALHNLEIGNPEGLRNALKDFPLSDNDKEKLLEFIENPQDYLGDMPKDERANFATKISYDTFLKQYAKASDSIINILQNICAEYWGFNIDHLSLYDAIGESYPATGNLKIDMEEYHGEPYIYHFPDGNASVARLLVRALIPNVSTSHDYNKMSAMEAIVLDKFNYELLDQENHLVQLRLNATCVSAKNVDGKVEVGYSKGNQLYKVNAKHAIMACNHRLMPYLIPEMEDDKKLAFSQNVKVPLIYTKILVKNWQAFKKLGVYALYAPKSPYVLVMLDYPVSMGSYQFPEQTDEPMIIHMVRIPAPYAKGKDSREACQMGRREIWGKSFADLEKEAVDQLTEIFSLANETLENNILAITINRWSHGYSYGENVLYDEEQEAKNFQEKVQQVIGNIHFANSDAEWVAYMHAAINQGLRAAREALA